MQLSIESCARAHHRCYALSLRPRDEQITTVVGGGANVQGLQPPDANIVSAPLELMDIIYDHLERRGFREAATAIRREVKKPRAAAPLIVRSSSDKIPNSIYHIAEGESASQNSGNMFSFSWPSSKSKKDATFAPKARPRRLIIKPRKPHSRPNRKKEAPRRLRSAQRQQAKAQA